MIRRTIDHFDGLKEKLESLLASSGLDGPPQVLPTTYGEGETRLEALVNATRYFFPKD